MPAVKVLEFRQAKRLCHDILWQDVGRFGWFRIGSYKVLVTNVLPMSAAERQRKRRQREWEKERNLA